jgi:alpha-L-fucosidase
MRAQGLKCGAYYSLIDWSYFDYPGFMKDSTRYQVKDDPARWQRFRSFYQGQINEIATQLKPDLWWFDGDWEHSAEEWEAAKVRAMILQKNPEAIINGRLRGFGDYATPEQNIPIETPKAPVWELCMTLGEQWGWQPQDTNYKSTHDLIHIFADVIGHGGNLLLGVGPREDGTFTSGQVSRLEDLGVWTKKHAEAIYGTRAGLPNGHFFGPSTLSPDSTTLYLFLANGMSGSVEIKGLDNKIISVEIVGSDADRGDAMTLNHRVVGKISWSKVPGLVFIDLKEGFDDPWMTVLKVKLDGPVKLYRGQGGY